MKKFVALLLVTLLTLAGMTAYAASDYKGFNIVNVKVNGKTLALEVPAINFHGSTLLPLRKVAEALGAQVAWDATTQTANLIKPEVNMILCDGVYFGDGTSETKSPDGVSFSDGTIIYNNWGSQPWKQGVYDLTSFVAVDDHNLTGKVEYRTVFEGTDGTALQTIPSSIELSSINESFSSATSFTDLPLNVAGDYKIMFQIKDAEGYKTVKTRTIHVK